MRKELLHTKLIREIIIFLTSGGYDDGQRLPSERELCVRFAVSRGTIRRAVAELTELGAITVRAGSGIYVRKFSHDSLPCDLLPPDFEKVSLRDIITARKAIELTAVELACDRITDRKVSELQGLIDDMTGNVENLPVFLKFDMLFHQSLVRAGGNVPLVTAFDAIFEYHKYSQIFTSLHAGQEQKALDYHRKILRAMQSGNKKLCQKILGEHLDATAKNLKNDAKNAPRTLKPRG